MFARAAAACGEDVGRVLGCGRIGRVGRQCDAGVGRNQCAFSPQPGAFRRLFLDFGLCSLLIDWIDVGRFFPNIFGV